MERSGQQSHQDIVTSDTPSKPTTPIKIPLCVRARDAAAGVIHYVYRIISWCQPNKTEPVLFEFPKSPSWTDAADQIARCTL